MNRRQEIISILTKCASDSTLSTEESKQLADWKALSKANEQLFEELTNEESKLKHLKTFSIIDVENDWDKLKNRLAPKVKKTTLFRKYLPYAAILGTGLFLYLTNYYINRPKPESIAHVNKETLHDIQAATEGATLILADGRTVELDQKTTIRNNQGLTFNSTGSELQITVDPDKVSDPSATNVMIVPKGAYYTVVLSDQTKVWVNANSKLTFPSSFSGPERRVQIDGEAFFEVSHDAKHPFIVETNGTQVQVLGTKFNVNAYTDHVKTTLEEGKVQQISNRQKVTLTPGQYAEWDGNNLQVALANLAKDLAWKNKEFRFENDDMIHIAYELSRWYDVQVKFVGDIDMKKQYSGSMSRNLSLSKVLNVLQFGSDFDFEIRDKELLIKNK